MPAKSKSQQRLFGMVTAYKEGKLKLDDLAPSLAKKIKSIADGSKKKTGDKRKKTKGITKKAAADYASTKHKGLPQKVKESFDFDRNEIIDIIYIYSKFDMNELQEMTDKELLDLYTTLEVDNFEDEIQQPEEDMYDTYYETHIKRASDFLNEGKDDEGYMDALEGGEAEDMTIEDIAKMHNVPVKYIENIMPSAIEIELEHTDDPEVAARIALDHLAETPLYYDDVIGLPNMEDELEDLDDEEIEEVISKKIEKYDDFNEEDKKVKTNEDLDTSISTPEEIIGKEAHDIMWALENKDKEGYRHLFDKYMKELERAGGDKKIFDNLPTDMDKTAYLLGLIYKQNYGEEQMKKKLEEVNPQKISAPFNTWVAASVAALKELGIEGIAKKAKTNESSVKKFNDFTNEGLKDFVRKTFAPTVEDAIEKIEKKMKKIDDKYEDLKYATSPLDKLESLMSFISSCYRVLITIEYIDAFKDELTEEQKEYIFSVLKKIGERFPHNMRGKLPETDIEDIIRFVKKFNKVSSKFGYELQINKFNLT